jgi:lipooligosaccharide transport system permease protein
MSTAVVLVGTRHALRVVERNARVTRWSWLVFVTGFLEPVLYLLSIGVGVGMLVDQVDAPGGPVDYELFVAPAMLAVAAMNGSVYDTTFNFFLKFKYAKVHDGMLATPIGVADVVRGELASALLRSLCHAIVFMITLVALGLAASWWAVLAVPAAALIGFAFAGAGLGLTTFTRSWHDFDFVQLAITPLFLFSATFFPLSRYPDGVEWLVRISPLYQGVAIERALVLGAVTPWLLVHAAYLVAMGWWGIRVAGRRLQPMLQP